MRERRALRQFTLSTGKSAGRNSSGRITLFHRGGGSKRLQRRIDLKRSTSSMGIVERIEYDPNRSSRIALVRWKGGAHQRKCKTIEEFAPPKKRLESTTTTIRGPFAFSSLPGKVDQRKVACFSPGLMAFLISFVFVFLLDISIYYIDFLLSAMETSYLPFGEGGPSASSSKRPLLDLNLLPSSEEEDFPRILDLDEKELSRRKELQTVEEKATERHVLLIEKKMKNLEKRAEEIARSLGCTPQRIEAIRDAVSYLSEDVWELKREARHRKLKQFSKKLENPGSSFWKQIKKQANKWWQEN